METNATPPKISFYSLPRQRPDPPGLATPPLRLPVSIPFVWEEAPGKPKEESGIRAQDLVRRHSTPSPFRSRVLDLPPRMAGKTDDVDSPTTVLDGPYSLSGCYSFAHAEEEPHVGVSGRKKEKAVWFWRRRKVRRDGKWEASLDGASPSFPNPSSVSSHSCYNSGDGDVGRSEEEERKVRLKRFRSSRSLALSVSLDGTSQLWARLCESMKQVVPWRRERKTQDS
ncbi:uncharacterized protein At4g00950-like [Typha angustifolia]|uniref:uncharacterized protein At4g00950-like n=1 Tax=Typha angustifolia TaxID=59011 RepID=UPI003C2C2C1C